MGHTKIDGGQIRAMDHSLPTPVLQHSQCKKKTHTHTYTHKLKEGGQIIIISDDIIVFQANSRH